MAKGNICFTLDENVIQWINEKSAGWKKSSLVNMILTKYITTKELASQDPPTRWHDCATWYGDIVGIWNKERNGYEIRCDHCDFYSILTKKE